MLMWNMPGLFDFQQIRDEVNREPPTLMESFVRAFFFEGIVPEDAEQNKGVAYRGGGSAGVFLPQDHSVVVGDSLWIGASVSENDGTPWVVQLFDEPMEWEEQWETNQGGVWVKCPAPGVYHWRVSTYGIELGAGTFRMASEEEVFKVDRFMDRIVNACSSCPQVLLDSVRSNVIQSLPFEALKPR